MLNLGGQSLSNFNETTALLECWWGHIFFPKSGRVGQTVAAAATEHVTPSRWSSGANPAYSSTQRTPPWSSRRSAFFEGSRKLARSAIEYLFLKLTPLRGASLRPRPTRPQRCGRHHVQEGVPGVLGVRRHPEPPTPPAAAGTAQSQTANRRLWRQRGGDEADRAQDGVDVGLGDTPMEKFVL
ncbi:hypothetical protein B0H11DRAFT_1363744 [Mycena galericulata]|nr:hypothetical protein B0H11DRAFT_1363744 [Mycena galericulata]